MKFYKADKETSKLRWFIFVYKNYNLDRLIKVLNQKFGQENVFCPVYKDKKFNYKKDKYEEILCPFYPGYIFIRSTVDEISKVEIKRDFLHSSFMKDSKGNYLYISDEEIEKIKKLEKEKDNTLEKFKEQLKLKPGNTVKIKEGTFSNFIGVIDSIDWDKKKCVLLVDLLGRKIDLQVPLEKIEVL